MLACLVPVHWFNICTNLFIYPWLIQGEAPVSHIVTVDEDGRTRPLQEIPAGWRWVHQSGAGLVVANQPDQPMQHAASLIMNNRADQHASGAGF